jgi:hypothetical protein
MERVARASPRPRHGARLYAGSVKLIFDTDMGNDIDDALALAA